MQTLKVYECHVKGVTKMCPFVEEKLRGTFLGLCDNNMISHLKSLGINTLQLMPIFEKKESYWGYDSVSWFNINPEFGTIDDFKFMLDKLQSNGIKVVLDVVYNHTGNTMQNVTYTEVDVTGCGFCVDVPKSLKTIMMSIDYWLSYIGVDGMRFDLAGALGRENGKGFNPEAEFFKRTKKYVGKKILIAEPYDLHEQSYGRFPTGWIELNHHFRDCVRSGAEYNYSRPNDLNYICCHDGFCMNDFVAYNNKHNSANGEDNRDGNDNNRSWNHGVEGNTYNKSIQGNRKLHKEWLMEQLDNCETHTLLLAGDELETNTQFGNNNTWCQDNPMGWVIWE